jgi:hypothetical protein
MITVWLVSTLLLGVVAVPAVASGVDLVPLLFGTVLAALGCGALGVWRGTWSRPHHWLRWFFVGCTALLGAILLPLGLVLVMAL